MTKTPNNSLLFFCIFFGIGISTIYAQLHNYEPFILKPYMQGSDTDSAALIWIQPKNSKTLKHAITALKAGEFKPHVNIRYPSMYTGGKNNIWIAIPLHHTDTIPFPLAIDGYGLQDDTIWIVNENFEKNRFIIQPWGRKNADSTFYFQHTRVVGTGIFIQPNEKWLIIKLYYHRYIKEYLPILSDARVYEFYYYKRYLPDTIIHLIFVGLSMALAVYFIIFYINNRYRYLFWYIAYILSLCYVSLDFVNWIIAPYDFIHYVYAYNKIFEHALSQIFYSLFLYYFISYKPKFTTDIARIIIGMQIIIVIVDFILLYFELFYESYILFLFYRNFIAFGSVALLIYILKGQETYSKIVVGGSLLMAFLICIGFIIKTMINNKFETNLLAIIGILLEYIIVSFAIHLRIRHQQENAQKIQVQNLALITENAELDARIRKELAHDIHDEMGSTITRLSLGLQYAKANPTMNSIQSVIDSALSDLHTIGDQMRDLIFDFNTEVVNVFDFHSHLRNIVNNGLARSNISVQFDMPYGTEMEQIIIPFEFKRHLSAITKECMHNIIKHSKARSVLVRFTIIHNEYQLTIKDDGMGMDLTKRPQGNGLKSIANRVDKMKAKWKMETQNGCHVEVKGSFT